MSKTEKQGAYAQLPKPLLNYPISVGAKMLFALLNDRFQLSLKNEFKDEDGCCFCYFSNREICDKLRCAHGKAAKLLRVLETAGLIYHEKLPGKPDRIYVGGVRDDCEDEACRLSAGYHADFEHAGTPKIGIPPCRFSAQSNTDRNNTNPIQTEESKERRSDLIERLELDSRDQRNSGQQTEHADRRHDQNCDSLQLDSSLLC